MQTYCSALGFAIDDALFQHYRAVYKGKSPKVVVIQRQPEFGVSSGKRASAWEISSDGSLLATVASDFTIELWASSTGSADKRRFTGHRAEVTSLAFSLDGLALASGSIDGQIRIWSLVNGTQLRMIEDIGGVTKVEFSSDGLSMLSISSDTEDRNVRILRVWNLTLSADGQEPSTRFMCKNSFTMATFSVDGKRIAAATRDGVFEVRNTADGTSISNGKTDMNPSCISLSPDGQRLAVSGGHQIQLWDISNPAVVVADIAAPTYGIQPSVLFSHDGEYLIRGSSIWRVRTLPPSVWSGLRLPRPLERYIKGPESLLSYKDGWISCAHPQGPLVEVPSYYRIDSHTPWRAHGPTIVFFLDNGKLAVVDCSTLIS